MKKHLEFSGRGRRGAAQSIESLVSLAILLMVFSVGVLALEPGMTKVNLDNFTRNLVRQIEVHGAIDSEIESYAALLADRYKLTPRLDFQADYIPGTKKIQIRKSFTVTVEQDVEIKLLSGAFSLINKKVTMVKTQSGMSEVLWK